MVIIIFSLFNNTATDTRSALLQFQKLQFASSLRVEAAVLVAEIKRSIVCVGGAVEKAEWSERDQK